MDPFQDNDNAVYSKIGVFDRNLLPIPFEGLEVITRDVKKNPTIIEFYTNISVNKTTSEIIEKKLVFTMYLTWEEKKVKSAASIINK